MLDRFSVMVYRARTMTDTGTRIRRVRIARDISQIELAKRAGLGEATVRRAEVGRGTPSTQTLGAIAEALDVRLAWLLDPHEAEGIPAPPGRTRISRKSPAKRPARARRGGARRPE
jgi:transcriptional regulator with XRE-family HTH domain